MTTNLVEVVNFVLRRTRYLSISGAFSATFYRLATLMPRMGLRQAKQIEAGHVYIEAVRKAMANYIHATWRLSEFKSTSAIVQVFHLGRTQLICETSDASMGYFRLSNVGVRMFMQRKVPPPAFKKVPDCSLRRHPKGRPQLTRIQNDMDVRETGEPKLCTVCRTSGHNRSTCPHCVYIFGQSSCNAGLEDDE
ncbi:hypothetical protein GOBAR_DD29583 [Gossypium barbadense]|nr:hypothetical protein GOBAR_DD29583 [Gossypium barbadense]